MAKLNDVKVMEAKDGVVTKIRYAGEDYEKVSERAEVGDIVQSKGDSTSELSVGDYARVDSNGWRLADLSLSEGDLVRIRDTGIIHDFIVDRVSDGKSEAFFALDLKKVDAPEITFEPGDLVRITKDQSGKPVGTIVEVTDVHPDLIWYPSGAPIGYAASKDAVELVCRKADRKDTVTVG